MKFVLFIFCILGSSLAFSISRHLPQRSTRTALSDTKTRKKAPDSPVADTFIRTGLENFDLGSLDHLGDVEETLSDVVINQLFGSSMIYTFAKVRKFVRDHPEYHWYKPELILTQDFDNTINEAGKIALFEGGNTGLEGEVKTYTHYIKRPITAQEILEFITNDYNQKIISREIKTEFTHDNRFGAIQLLNQLKTFEGEIVEFNDHFDDHELVYAMTVNRSRKRITICFRGTVWDNTDFWQDIKIKPTEIDTPLIFQQEGWEEPICVHTGFYEYVFHKTGEGSFKIDDILGQIRDVYHNNPKYADYDLYICGHSLGGALSTLLSFMLASSGKIKDILQDRPIRNISFASFRVGTEGFVKAFQKLEKDGLVHHIRLSNEGDLIPVMPPMLPWKYGQTGVNLHLSESKKMEIGYLNDKTFVSQLSMSPKTRHSLKSYFRRFHKCEENMDELDSHGTFEKLYQNHT